MKILLIILTGLFTFLPCSATENAQVELQQIDWTKKFYRKIIKGLHVIWTGSELLTMDNQQVIAPDWFVEPLPSYSLEAMLWHAGGKTVIFNERQQDKWQEIKLLLIDLPESTDIFVQRHDYLKAMVKALDQPYIEIVTYFPVKNQAHLIQQFEQAGDEGLVIQDGDALYQGSQKVRKLQAWQRGQAKVIDYLRSKVNQNKIEALQVQLTQGQPFYISLGLSEIDKLNPPEIGSNIIYRYNQVLPSEQIQFATYIGSSPQQKAQ